MNDWVDVEEELTKELCFRGTEMTNDRELLELAAKAAGYNVIYFDNPSLKRFIDSDGEEWNPLTDDGDALRLAVKLELDVAVWKSYVAVVGYDGLHAVEDVNDDPYAATRRAIVRAAAEIGKEMK